MAHLKCPACGGMAILLRTAKTSATCSKCGRRVLVKKPPMKTQDDVSLTVDSIHWSRLPAGLRRKVVAGINRVSLVHSALRADVLVRSLPPVHIVGDAIWSDPARTGFVSGRATVLRIGSEHVVGVEIPAQTVLASEIFIRTVLTHEFGHCFYFATQVMERSEAGAQVWDNRYDSQESLYVDEAADRARLVEPREWFTEPVARTFPYWHDPRLTVPEDEEDDLITLLKPFRIENGGRGFAAPSVSIPVDWIEHIHRLRNQEAEG